MNNLISENIARHWLDSVTAIPTRSLQLSFETAASNYKQLSDFSIILAILRNNPSIVPPDLVDQVEILSQITKTERFHLHGESLKKRRNPLSATIDPFKPILGKYYAEKKHGLHQYNEDEDYSIDLVSNWLVNNSSKCISEKDIFVFGYADYLRLAARSVENLSNKRFQNAYAGFYTPSIVSSLGREKQFNKKSLSKALKKLSRNSYLQGNTAPEHQDIILFLSRNRIIVRPASFVQETHWKINKAGQNAFGSVHNILTDESPVHTGEDCILELEDLINSTSASERDFQIFFESYPRFLLGTDYDKLISQPILVREDESNLIPDFILIPHSFTQPKILDLKLPSMNITRHTPNREGFLQAVMVARDQLLEYRNYFSSKATAEMAKEEFGCDLYFPKITVVIGRSSSFASEFERRKVESRIPDLEVLTYDDILQRAKQCRNLGLL